MRNWDHIYRTRGELQKEVLPKIIRISKIFKQRRFKEILDLGCGTGRHTIFLASKGFRVTGVDISAAAIKITSEKLKKSGIKNARLLRHDMEYLPFPDNHFDAVICTGVLSHGKIGKIKNTVAEIRRVLRKGGLLIADPMSTRDPDYGTGKEIEPGTFIGLAEEEDTPHHYYTREEVVGLFSNFSRLWIRHGTKKISYKKRKGRTCQWHIVATK